MKQSKAKTGRIPILIELRGMSPSTLQPLQLLGAWCSPYGIEPRALMRLIAAGRVVLIFDAFDEMAEAGDPEAKLSHFRTIWRFAYSRNKILITGRPNFFLDETELKTALGIEKASAAGPYCEAQYLTFFGLEQIEETLTKMGQARYNEIVSLAKTDQKFLDLIARPSLLYIVGLLWSSENLSSRVSLNSADIIELFVRNSYRRQAQKTEDDREFMDLSPAEREYFMDGIAACMLTSRSNNQILQDKFRNVVEKLLELLPDDINLRTPATQAGPIKPLKERLRGRPNPLRDIETDVRTYGILVADYSKPGALRFAHKSFFEFLVARLVARRILGKDKEETGAILLATGANPRNITEMTESLAFLGEIISQSSYVGEAQLVRGNERILMQSLFNAIVLRSKFRISVVSTRLLIMELRPGWIHVGGPHSVFSTFRMFDIFLGPSVLVGMSLWTIAVYYGGYSWLPTMMTRTLFPMRTDVFSFGLVMDLAFGIFSRGCFALFFGLLFNMVVRLVARATHIKRDIELWYLVVASMGSTYEEFAKVYGRWAAGGMYRLRHVRQL